MVNSDFEKDKAKFNPLDPTANPTAKNKEEIKKADNKEPEKDKIDPKHLVNPPVPSAGSHSDPAAPVEDRTRAVEEGGEQKHQSKTPATLPTEEDKKKLEPTEDPLDPLILEPGKDPHSGEGGNISQGPNFPDPKFQERVERELTSAQANRDSRSRFMKDKIKNIIKELKKENVVGDQRYNYHKELDKLIDDL